MDEEKKNINVEVDNFKVSQDIPKKKSRFAIKYLFFVIILAVITAIAIYFTIDKLEKEMAIQNRANIENVKKESDDSKYVISSYTDTYDTNSIKITEYYDYDGAVTTDDSFNGDYNYRVNYIQIEGLKNKKVQNEINQKLRKKAYSLKHKNTYTSVSANFSNILSVVFFNDENKTESLNINLATGEEIKFEELFVSSTPINSYLVNALYETLAWQSIDLWEDENNDLSKIDMSDYEDRFLMLINKYNRNKDNLIYYISANSIYIYGLIDKNILNSEYADETTLVLDLTECMNEVTMYKKFLTNESIYEDNTIGVKGTIVFTDSNEDYEVRINYGKIKDNIFLEEVVMDYINDYYTNNQLSIARKYVEKLSKEAKENIIKQSKSNRGFFLQREYQLWYDEEKEYTVVNVAIYNATCSVAYFENDAFCDYIKMKAMPKGDAVLSGFNEYMQDSFPNLNIFDSKYEIYFLNNDGELIGTSYEEVQEKFIKEQMENQITNETTNITSTNTVDVNNTTVNNTTINDTNETNITTNQIQNNSNTIKKDTNTNNQEINTL